MAERGEIKTCPTCAEPVVFTTEFPGVEYVCVSCPWRGGVFQANTSWASPERVLRHAEVIETYEKARAERAGRPYRPPSQDGDRPVCKGCGVVAEGRLDHSGKPAHWFSRTIRGTTEYACSRSCIGSEPVLPW